VTCPDRLDGGFVYVCVHGLDRLLAGRPIISLSRSEFGKRNARCSNPSMSEILIRSIGTFPRHAHTARDDSTEGIIRAAMKGSFQRVCPPDSDMDFPIVFLDGQLMDSESTVWAPFIIVVSCEKLDPSGCLKYPR
jgi:hypothetical protein